jgi:cysteine desulfurase / selenocysteine lyase
MYNIERIRNDFPALHKMTFFGSAGVGPLPRVAMVAMQRYSRELRVDFSPAAWKDDPISEACSLAADMVNAFPEDIVVTTSASSGINLFAGAVNWKKRDNIVISSHDYPQNAFPWIHQANKHGTELRVVPFHDEADCLSEMIAAIDQKTRVLAISHVEYATGFRNDLTSLAKAVHKAGGMICVDASQSMGVIPIDVQAMDIDVLATSGEKWLCGPLGTGFAYIRQDLAGSLQPATIDYGDITASAHHKVWDALVSGKKQTMDDAPLPRNAQRFQPDGLSPVSIKGLSSSLSYMLELGKENVLDRITYLVAHLIKRLQESNIGIISSTEPENLAGIVTASVPYDLSNPKETRKLIQKLQHARIVAHPRAGGLRLSVHFFNTEEEIDYVVDFISKL